MATRGGCALRAFLADASSTDMSHQALCCGGCCLAAGVDDEQLVRKGHDEVIPQLAVLLWRHLWHLQEERPLSNCCAA